MTPTELTEAVAALETALATGELTVEYAGRRFTYQSTDSIIKALDYFKRQQQGVPSTGPAPSSADRGSYASFERD
ncbi:MAG: hypothetical protein FJX45_18500 [Alphaproteobacteria bacterium]|nr:hypothetical protein [Alphaproteobacteria bacterium]MBM3654683.1 hypothetical protein [Alphaproteobacteria bacterium]